MISYWPDTTEKWGDCITDNERMVHRYNYQRNRWPGFIFFGNLHKFFGHLINDDDFKDTDIIDFGCGSGRHLEEVSHFKFKSMTGVDISSSGLTIAASTLSQGIFIKHDLCESLDSHYNTGICFSVLQHLRNPSAGLDTIGRAIRRGGVLYLCCYRKRGILYETIIPWLRRLAKDWPNSRISKLSFILSLFTWWLPQYWHDPFWVGQMDWFERIAVPITGNFARSQLAYMLKHAGFDNWQINKTRSGWAVKAIKTGW